jgi:hypothetical protein
MIAEPDSGKKMVRLGKSFPARSISERTRSYRAAADCTLLSDEHKTGPSPRSSVAFANLLMRVLLLTQCILERVSATTISTYDIALSKQGVTCLTSRILNR